MVQNKVTQGNKFAFTDRNIEVMIEIFFILLEIRKVLVIVTDGYSNGISVDRPAQQLKNSGVIIFSVGIGPGVSLPELRVMASKPVDQHIFTVKNFAELDGLGRTNVSFNL